MPYIVVESFKGGLDRRRSDLVSAPGMLIKAENVHVTRGGEIEKRKAFVAVDAGVDTEHTNPFEGTFGMESTGEGTTVFTTSYQQVSWYNAGRWIRFIYIYSGDHGLATIGHDKLFYRFGNRPANETHQADLPNLSISDPQIQIPEFCDTIEISFDQPAQNGPLQNSFYVKLRNNQYSVVLVCDDGLVQEGVALDVDTKTLDYGDIMIVNLERKYATSVSYNWGGNTAGSSLASRFQVYNQSVGTPAVILKGHAFDVPKDIYVDLTGGSNPNWTYPSPFIRGAWVSEQGISNFAFIVSETRPWDPNYHGVRQLSVPLAWNRKSIRQRITSIYTDIKVVEVDHPDKVQLTGIVYSTVYGGKSFVLAKFANGDVLPFYDGKLVGAFTDGVYREYYGGLYRFIESIKDLAKGGIDLAKANYDNDTSNDDPIRKYTITSTQTQNGASLTIAGPINADFKVDAFIDSPCSYTIETIQKPVAPIADIRATASMTLAGGSNGSATTGLTLRKIGYYGNVVPPISGIFVTTDYDDPSVNIAGAIELTGLNRSGSETIAYPFTGYTSPDAWHENQQLAYAISFFINSNTPVTGFYSNYSNYGHGWAMKDPASFTITSTPKLGGPMNGRGVWIEFTSPVNILDPNPLDNVFIEELIDPATTRVSPFDPTRWVARLGYSYQEYPTTTTYGKLINGARNSVDSVVANGVELLSDIDPFTMGSPTPDKAQYFSTTLDQLNFDVINSINHGSATHGYSAVKEGEKIVISSNVLGAAGNNKSIRVTTSGTVTRPGMVNFGGGRDNYDGAGKIMRINFNGTPVIGNKCWIMITDPTRPGTPYKFGATRMAGKKGSFCFTYKGKQYIGVGSVLYFSSLNNPTKWDTYDTGSGFIDMANNFGGRDDLTGAGVYQNNIAVFTERNCQLWFFDPDPNQNSQRQVLDNTGCLAPNSVVSVGATDLFYLSYNGIRSLQSRESTDAAYANDIGSPIDEIVIAILASLTPEQRAAAKGLIEPVDGRYWISIGSRLFVLSYFKGSGILAWSEYVPGMTIDEMVTFKDKVYIRSGNKIYLYGGPDGNTYDSCPVVVEMPYLDANKPATFKAVNGMDITCQGTWKAFMGFDYTNANARDEIATFTQPSFALGKIPATGIGTHIGVRLTSNHSGYSKLANVIVHYDELHSKHDAG
jgi:hypothetical protein